MRFFYLLLSFFCVVSVYAGPHTLQRGETFADVAKLYNIPLDSLLKANPNTEAYVGLTIDVPLSILVYDLGDSDLFRNVCNRIHANSKRGIKKYKQTYEKQLRWGKTSGTKRQKLGEQIICGYMEAVQDGNIDALYQLGRQKVHCVFYGTEDYPDFSQEVNTDLAEFRKGIEYLQIAALIGRNRYAMIELAMACGYEKSPIRNPYLCLGMLEHYQKEFGVDVRKQICYMYETGYGIRPDLFQAYIYCPSTELTIGNKGKTHREEILEKIESMPTNFESSRYGVGLDGKTLLSIGLSHYHNDVLDPEGVFWLHRAARQNDADANWALAGRLPKDEIQTNDYEVSLFGLEMKGLVHIAKTEGEHVEDAKLTYYGFSYLRVNHKLRNPFPYFAQLEAGQWMFLLNLINIILLLSVLLKIILRNKYS